MTRAVGLLVLLLGCAMASFPVDFRDTSVSLVSKDNKQRDDLLQQKILPIWKTVLAKYRVTNLKIQYKDYIRSTDDGASVVQYLVTGSSGLKVSYDDAVDAFQDAVQNAMMKDVKLAFTAPEAGKKGRVRLTGWFVECDKPLAQKPSTSEKDCRSKCSGSCLFANYDSIKNQCAVAPASSDCVFTRQHDKDFTITGTSMVLATVKRASTSTVKNVGYSDYKGLTLTTKAGKNVLLESYVDSGTCSAMCSLLPTCKVAYMEYGMGGQNSCNLFKKEGVSKAIPQGPGSTATASYLY